MVAELGGVVLGVVGVGVRRREEPLRADGRVAIVERAKLGQRRKETAADSSGELDLQAFTQMVEDMNIFDSFIDVLHKQKKKKQGRRDSTTRRPSLADLATMRKMADRWSAEDDDGW